MKLFTGKAGDVSTLLKQAKGWGYYSPQISDELNVELYLRERCSFSFVDGCAEFRKFYDGWKHLDRIPTLDTCPICGNIGFAAILSGITGGRMRSAGGCKCFLAGTQVLTPNGKHKSIEAIDVGDEVIATDPETGETEARKVTRLIITDSDKKFNELTIETPDGNKKLTATHEHPFWSPSERRWTEAGQLRPGMTLRSDDGSSLLVKANRSFNTHARTYNLTIDGLRTYYVLAGETPVLVHNSNGLCGTGFRTASQAGISPNDARRIQNAADKAGQPVIVVGSRANGSANSASDWDYILSGPSRSRHSQQSSLPRGTGDGEGSGRGRDFWQNYNPSRPDYAELDPSKPYVIFEPRSR